MLRLGDKVLSERSARGLSITQLSKKTGVGINEICDMEMQHATFIKQEIFHKLASVLDLKGYECFTYEKPGEILGTRIKKARVKMGYTQKKVAEMAHLSTPITLTRLEKGYCSKISEETFSKLKDILQLDREDFELFIQKGKNTTKKEKNNIINIELIQSLITQKRKELELSREILGKKADVSSRTIKRIEEKTQAHYNKQKLLQIMYALHFSEEEIIECFPSFREQQDLNDEIPKKLQKKI